MNEKMIAILDKMADYMDDVFGDDVLLSGGPGHIVFDDYNLDDSSIEWCLNYTDEFLNEPARWGELPILSRYSEETKREILLTTRQFLVDLLAIPEEERYVYEEEDFELPVQEEHEWHRIGRAVEVNIDRLSDDNLIVFYLVYGEDIPQADGSVQLEVRGMTPLRLYENVSRTSLSRLAAFMETADNEMMEGQAQQIREYLLETQAKFN
jgi:hypothetical protein